MKRMLLNSKDHVTLSIDDEALAVLMLTPYHTKGAPRSLKRLIRIRRNLLRELEAINKELKRHKGNTIISLSHQREK